MARFMMALLTGLGYLLVLPLAPFAIRIVQEYERGVIFRLGRLQGARGPGLFVILPIVERMVKVDLRTVTMDVPSQEAITRDNVTVRVNAVVYFHVMNPEYAVVKVVDHVRATFQISQTSLRSVLGQSDLDELLAERERRAKVINAEGEYQAAERLAEAGRIMAAEPATLQLRFLQTLTEVASERNSTIVFPVPIDLIHALMGGRRATAGDGGSPGDGGAAPSGGAT